MKSLKKSLLMMLMMNLTATIALAGPVQRSTPKERGINEEVTIQSFGSLLSLGRHWGFKKEMGGFQAGASTFRIVPVTRETSELLRSLDRKTQYNCVIVESTFIPDDAQYPQGSGNYYVLDMDCR